MSRCPEVVVLDTCVLLSSVLRCLLLSLADQGGFKPVWSPIIGQEWRRNAGRLWQVEQAEVDQQWNQLEADYPAASVGDVDAYKHGLVYSDPKDWHVVAAARAVLAREPGLKVSVVTRNVRDFNRSELRRFGLTVLDPDQLLVLYWQEHRPATLHALSRLLERLAQEDRPVVNLHDLLKRERLFRFNRLYADCAAQ